MYHNRSARLDTGYDDNKVNNGSDGFEELLGLNIDRSEKFVKHYRQTIPVNIHHFYMVEDIGNVSFYLNMINTIRTAEAHDTVFIYMNTNGGNLHTAIEIMASIRASQATIITCLEGTVASAGTMVFLSGNKHMVAENSSFMIHNYSQGVYGKGNDVTAQVDYTKEFFKKFARNIYNGFLTDEEIDSVLQGKDIWMDSDEVSKRLGDKLIQNMPSPADNEIEAMMESIIVGEAPLPVDSHPVKPKPKKENKSKAKLKHKALKKT